MTAIRLETVAKRYSTGDHEVVALAGASLDVARGTFTTIMGPSGSGKSTLLHCAVGLDRPDSGSVVVDGVELGGLGERELTEFRRERIGFVFQSYNLIAALTAAQNALLPARLAGRRVGPTDALDALDSVGLRDRADHRPHQLSGGEQQRVAIARAVLTKPAVVCADEPTGALDLARGRQVLEHLRSVVDAHGRTVVVVTHDPAVAARGDRVVFMADGRIVDEIDAHAGDTLDTESVAVRMAKLEEA
ncbi:ABC transporter ATP-binding protein [Spiractinospora alimapuensis]|uniref:ABC transporter ATP-binding protein n=1 Tax=Spiractinospora alimapuensis TaxID=2820884 RepID=UPI001F15B8B3|nr:ABC transporter ATP-binding protein [Spiractinospora alimapuensis]QVQ54498.1 ABC transporter ATP-binding protein [Spiractinospora alimapuensis]